MKFYALAGLLVAAIVIVTISVCAFRLKSQTLKTEKFNGGGFSNSKCKGGITVTTTTFTGKKTYPYSTTLSCVTKFWPDKYNIPKNVVKLGFSANQNDLKNFEVRFYDKNPDAKIVWNASNGSIEVKAIPTNVTNYAIKLQSVSKPTCSNGTYTYTHAGKADETVCFPQINEMVKLPRSITSIKYSVPPGFWVHLQNNSGYVEYGHTSYLNTIEKDFLVGFKPTHMYVRKDGT